MCVLFDLEGGVNPFTIIFYQQVRVFRKRKCSLCHGSEEQEPRKIKGFSRFCPVSQFFLLFNTIKNFNKIKEITKKTGKSGQSLFFDTKEDEFYWTKDGAMVVLLD